MFNASDFNLRTKKMDQVVSLANALVGSPSVRAEDPIQVWEEHPIIAQYLDELNDREIMAAIDAVNAN